MTYLVSMRASHLLIRDLHNVRKYLYQYLAYCVLYPISV